MWTGAGMTNTDFPKNSAHNIKASSSPTMLREAIRHDIHNPSPRLARWTKLKEDPFHKTGSLFRAYITASW